MQQQTKLESEENVLKVINSVQTEINHNAACTLPSPFKQYLKMQLS